MGSLRSFPGVLDDSMNNGLEALFARPPTLRSVSFNGRDSEPCVLKTFSHRMSFIRREVEIPKRTISRPVSSKFSRLNPLRNRRFASPGEFVGPGSPKHEAAVKLQKVYKSFRTRRQLADCAVLVEQRWWKLLDFAQLRRSSVSFFDLEKAESAVSRWSRARTKAAKVGKGLSKDKKAQKLALQHWLEAIDPRHRYGHNLHFYYDCWVQCDSRQPFFYWLDVGEGKEVNLEEQYCTRSKLQQQCIKYLGPKEREAYEVVIEDGKFFYRRSWQLLDSSDGPKGAKLIFVLSTSKELYVGQKRKGIFQHSSFLAGGATSAAGRLVVENGILKAVWPHSGHYRPTEENFQEFMSFLEENNVDLTHVKKSPAEEDDESHSELVMDERTVSEKPETEVDSSHGFSGMDTDLVQTFDGAEEEPDGSVDNKQFDLVFDKQTIAEDHQGTEEANLNSSDTENEASSKRSSDDTEQQCSFRKRNLFLEEDRQEDQQEIVPSELILRRINSKKGIKSYQLGKQLSLRWTTGAGPRIVCVRDYPSELQFQALEQVSLSPQSAAVATRFDSPRT